MLTVNTKQIRGVMLLMIALFGLASGYCAANFSGWLLASTDGNFHPVAVAPLRAATTGTVDVAAILQGNIFDPSARNMTTLKQPA